MSLKVSIKFMSTELKEIVKGGEEELNMSFFANLENKVRYKREFPYYFGQIKGRGLDDYFRAPATFWNRDQYYSSWLAAFEDRERLSRFVIVTSMYHPIHANFIEGWVFYIQEQNVFLQNHLFLLKNYPRKKHPNFNDMPGPRQVVDEDGGKLSEWVLSLREVEEFFDALKEKRSLG